MEILGIGLPELAFIVIIALILLGPKDMEKTGRTIGKWLNDLVKSDAWQVMRDTSKMVSNLPTRLMREANLEEMQRELNPIPNAPNIEDDPAQKDAPAQAENAILPPKSQPYAPGKPSAAKSAAATEKKPAAKKSATPRQTKPKKADKKSVVRSNKSKAGKKTNA